MIQLGPRAGCPWPFPAALPPHAIQPSAPKVSEPIRSILFSPDPKPLRGRELQPEAGPEETRISLCSMQRWVFAWQPSTLQGMFNGSLAQKPLGPVCAVAFNQNNVSLNPKKGAQQRTKLHPILFMAYLRGRRVPNPAQGQHLTRACLLAHHFIAATACHEAEYGRQIRERCLRPFRLSMEGIGQRLWCDWDETMG